jgi:hypothetical protein
MAGFLDFFFSLFDGIGKTHEETDKSLSESKSPVYNLFDPNKDNSMFSPYEGVSSIKENRGYNYNSIMGQGINAIPDEMGQYNYTANAGEGLASVKDQPVEQSKPSNASTAIKQMLTGKVDPNSVNDYKKKSGYIPIGVGINLPNGMIAPGSEAEKSYNSIDRNMGNVTSFENSPSMSRITASRNGNNSEVSIPKSGIADLIKSRATDLGVDPDVALAIAHKESALNPNAQNKLSSAGGLYQFIDGTWKSMVGKYGSQYGVGVGDKKDAKANATMGVLHIKENKDYLTKQLGREPTGTDLYLAHFMGAGKAAKFLSALKDRPNASVESFFTPAELRANPNLRGSLSNAYSNLSLRPVKET